MAAIDNLIEQISDPVLKQRISSEVARMKQQKKFGLVFEEHLPEATPLYDVPIKKNSLVAEKDGFFKIFYRVKRIDGDTLICETQDDKHEEICFEKDRMVAVAMFGEPIYPYLKPIDEVQKAPESKLWHTLIEAENYHALQLLVYLYGGMVDCIYIDPPYNTGDKSWKYNNDYVDCNDSYRHSKWLSMMKKRLVLAKKLLNPNDSVLIVTIDEREYLRLGCLLEEIFSGTRIQMIATLITPQGNPRDKQFYRTDEYIFIVGIGNAQPYPLPLDQCWRTGQSDATIKNINWVSLLRTGSARKREDRIQMFYPFFIKNTNEGPIIDSIGDTYLQPNIDDVSKPEGTIVVWPIGRDGELRRWQVSPSTAQELKCEGFLRLGKWNGENTAIQYLADTNRQNINDGLIPIRGRRYDGSIIVDEKYIPSFTPGSLWKIPTHDATRFGSQLLFKVIGEKRFEFPKSLYAVHDAIRFFVANKPNALIVDFFAGSGTTLHAVNLLNAEDGGHRQCIMVTNNEVSAEEENRLKTAGYHPGQEEWEKWGIARYVNWPRTRCSILGVDVNGEALKGNYQTYLKQEKERERTIKQITLIDNPSSLKTTQKKELVALCCQGKLPQSLVKADTKFIVSEDHQCTILFDINYAEEWLEVLEDQDQLTEFYIVTRNDDAFKKLKKDIQELLGNIIEEVPVMRPMSEGFAANAKYFKLGFLDKNSVALARQFHELLPLLWMKSGGVGRCPELTSEEVPDMLILEENGMAILNNEDYYSDFRSQLAGREDIRHIYFVTNSGNAFREMSEPFTWAQTYQLYKDYLENFTINYEK